MYNMVNKVGRKRKQVYETLSRLSRRLVSQHQVIFFYINVRTKHIFTCYSSQRSQIYLVDLVTRSQQSTGPVGQWLRSHGVVVITFALHAKGREFDPRWGHLVSFQRIICNIFHLQHIMHMNTRCSGTLSSNFKQCKIRYTQ